MDDATGGPIKVSAAYGHACANCVKTKCRCIPRDGGGSCERCHRLSKECQPATFVRKRGGKKAAPTRKSQLEQKLENLVNLLQAQQQSSISDGQSGSQKTLDALSDARDVLTPAISETYTSPFPEGTQAEQELLVFQRCYLDFFPCVHIPTGTTAEQLQQDRPLLFKAIRVASTRLRSRQHELGREVREEIARRAVANGERSLELLLALLVCMTWFFYFTKERPSLGMFSGVARSIIADLRLDKPLNITPGCPRQSKLPSQPESKESRTDEEMRTLVACFALSSMISISLQYEPMRWSLQLDESCRRLCRPDGVPGDKALVAMARISKVAIEGAKTIERLQEDPDYAAHALLHTNALRALLDSVKVTLSAAQLQNKTVLAFLHSTEVLIYEAALFEPPSSLCSPALDMKRIDCLTACLYATKATLDNFNSLPLKNFTLPSVLSFSHSSFVLFRLSLLEFSGWDRVLARATADVIYYVEQAWMKNVQANEEIEKETGEESVFGKASEPIRLAVVAWKEKLDSATAPALVPVPTHVGAALGTAFETMESGWATNFGADPLLFSSFARWD